MVYTVFDIYVFCVSVVSHVTIKNTCSLTFDWNRHIKVENICVIFLFYQCNENQNVWNKTDRHDIIEILLKVALNTTVLTPEIGPFNHFLLSKLNWKVVNICYQQSLAIIFSLNCFPQLGEYSTLIANTMKKQSYHIVWTVPKSNRIIAETDKIYPTNTHIHDHSLSWVGTGISIKVAGLN